MTTATLTLRDTTVGRKIVMAASGVILFGFSIVHMLGNMQIFVGPEAINRYHVLLYSMPAFLWSARALLFAATIAHVVSAASLTVRNRAARPEGYRKRVHVASSYAARTMVYGGVLLAIYLTYHVAHMTAGATAGLGYQHDHLDVYANLVSTYQVPWAVALNVGAAMVFGLHVYHGAWSLLQSLGINHARYNVSLRQAAMALALVVVLGFVSVPLGVFFGVVG
jgi:succinate dehydrogenase / fumarate reductase cytochrome b subunit